MTVEIRRCTAANLDDWSGMRAKLWPEEDAALHRAEASELLGSDAIAFVARDGAGAAIGFAEAALRHDYVNGCETSPVAFLEGIFVEERARRAGVGRLLCRAVESWARESGCREFASDALLDNAVSHAMHAALGFAETERVVCFRKLL